MAGRSTSPAQPQRLARVGSEWRLELEQLVYSSSHLLRPRRSEVRGEQAILQRLRALGDGELLVREAERLFRTSPASVDVAYVAQDSSWVPDVQEQLMESEKPKLADGAAELEQARRKADRFAKKVAALEATVRTLQEALKSQAQARRPSAAESEPEPQTEAEVPAVQPAWGAGDDVQAPTQEVRAIASSSFVPGPVAIAEPAVPASADGMKLPTAAALGELLRELGGASANVFPVDDATWMQTTETYWCLLRDDSENELAAIVFDFECAVRLAGALLMESAEALQVILEQHEMSADMQDAASEVGNTVASVFNKVEGNPHVRAAKLSPVDDDARAWLGTVSDRQCYRYAPGGLLGLCVR